MHYRLEKQPQKLFIGLELRTSNQDGSKAIGAHWQKFYQEDVLAQIPGKLNHGILSLYTDYEGDLTKPYSCIIGCEVSSLAHVPKGLVGKVIPAATYAVFTSQGPFPQGLLPCGKPFGNRRSSALIRATLNSTRRTSIRRKIQK